jgi:hypothetical protein
VTRRREHDRPRLLQPCALLGAVALVWASGCGGAQPRAEAAHVARATISEQAVRHWTVAFERGGVQTVSAQSEGISPQRRAEEYLITSRWLLAEAARRGVAPRRRQVQQRLEDTREAIPGGQGAFAESLASSGRTLADAELEIEVELAGQALRRIALAHAGTVSDAAAASAYRAEAARYRTPERRSVELVEHLPSAALARRLAPRLGTGARFARRAYHESWERPAQLDSSSEKGRLLRAIFTASPGTLVGPMRLNRAWTLFVVRRVAPAGERPLSAVRASIGARLEKAQRAQALRRFSEAMRERWRALTSCRPGYVVPQCSQYIRPFHEADLLAPAVD